MRRWRRDDLLRAGCSFDWKWTLRDQTDISIGVRVGADKLNLACRRKLPSGEWHSESYDVRLAWTGCYLGGRRRWFLCPAAGCGRRVAILYNGGIFACRHCCKLAYRCQGESTHDREVRSLNKIRTRLGWMPGIFNPSPGRPKRMHLRTYWRLLKRHIAGAQLVLDELGRQLGITQKLIDGVEVSVRR